MATWRDRVVLVFPSLPPSPRRPRAGKRARSAAQSARQEQAVTRSQGRVWLILLRVVSPKDRAARADWDGLGAGTFVGSFSFVQIFPQLVWYGIVIQHRAACREWQLQ